MSKMTTASPHPPPITVSCRCCGGSGRIELTGAYRETLDLLRSHGREINGADLARLAGVKGTAMNNRLVALEQHGLARGRMYGRERLWVATEEN